jgi:hypothetical protein
MWVLAQQSRWEQRESLAAMWQSGSAEYAHQRSIRCHRLREVLFWSPDSPHLATHQAFTQNHFAAESVPINEEFKVA